MSEKNTANKVVTSPLLKTVNDFMRLLKGFMLLVFISYLLSGITLIKPDEVGFILRMGKIVGNTPLDQIHEPGWIFALPSPFDTVIKLPVKRVLQVGVNELAARPKKKAEEEEEYGNISTIDPTKEGYCITGDENIYQTSVVIKYQITEPIKLVLGYSNPISMSANLIHDLTVAEMVSVSCKFTIDGLLTKDKKELSQLVKDQVQAKLEAVGSGLSIVSLEVAEMIPPPFLKFDFEDVQSAFVDRHQFVNKAKSRRETKLPEAQSSYEETINTAMAYSEETLANAEANAGQFSKMLDAYKESPEEIKTEMKNRTLKKLISNTGNLIIFPDTKTTNGNTTLLLGMNGSIQTAITTPEGYYDEAD